jgi:tetratricopeptide (TPR) repeat protein
MTTLFRLLALIVSTIALGCVLPAFADSPLMRGIDAYKKNDYVRAQAFLRQAIKFAPEDSVAHYYMGNTLVKLKSPSGARAEFQSASDSSETDDIKENCKAALQKLQLADDKRSNRTGLKSAESPSKASFNSNNGKIDSAIDDLSKKDVTPSIRLDSLPLTAEERKSISPYLKQNGEVDQTKSTSMIKDLLPSDLKNKVQTMGPKDPSLPGLLSDLFSQSQFGNNMSPGERKIFIEDELHKRNIPMDSILQIINGKSGSTAASKSNAIQDERTKRLKEVQDNLDDQMNSKVGNSSVHLKQEGTSIYVRNYEHH